jgi:lysylphosphatidylglycerol synthetase-like protein (DUF2156 family)
MQISLVFVLKLMLIFFFFIFSLSFLTPIILVYFIEVLLHLFQVNCFFVLAGSLGFIILVVLAFVLEVLRRREMLFFFPLLFNVFFFISISGFSCFSLVRTFLGIRAAVLDSYSLPRLVDGSDPVVLQRLTVLSLEVFLLDVKGMWFRWQLLWKVLCLEHECEVLVIY